MCCPAIERRKGATSIKRAASSTGGVAFHAGIASGDFQQGDEAQINLSTFALVPALFLVATLMACIPARRAAKADPMAILRSE